MKFLSRGTLASAVSAVCLSFGLASGSLHAQMLDPSVSAPASAQARIFNARNEQVGTARFRDTDQGLLINVEVKGVPAGKRGMHIHQNGECAPGPDAVEKKVVDFGAAGPHFDPMMTNDHGAPHEQHVHAGELPNLTVARNGAGTLEHLSKKLSVAPGKQSLLGRSIVIHAKEDDYRSDPAGNSGERIFCGVIEPLQGNVTRRFILPGSNVFPEGIAYDEQAQVIYTASAAEGHLYKVSLQDGKAERFALGGSPGRQAALGMKLDSRKRLWLAGQASGAVSVVSTQDGSVLATLKTPKDTQAFVNDLVIAADGNAYVTDSMRPVIFRAQTGVERPAGIEAWLDLSQTPIRYEPGINLNGIVASADGKTLLTIQSNTGKLWRIDVASKRVQEVQVEGGALKNGDGLLLKGNRLYVVRNAEREIAIVELSTDLLRGRVQQAIKDERFKYPTTVAAVGNELVVVDSQLDRMKKGGPLLPFELLGVTAP